MKVIPFDKIQSLHISPHVCYEWEVEAIAEKEQALLPAKISLKPGIEGVFYNAMLAILPAAGVGGSETGYPISRKGSQFG